MTLSVAVGLSVLLSAVALRAGQSSKTAKAGLFLIVIAWLGYTILAVIKTQAGCRPFGECYGTEYDADLGICELLSGLSMMAGWVTAAIGVFLSRRKNRTEVLYAQG